MLLYANVLFTQGPLGRVNRLRGILELLRPCIGLLTARILLLLLLDRLLTLLCEEDLLVRLVLLVLAHQLVELLLGILNLRHQMLRRVPRQPRTHLANVQVVLGILGLEDLGHNLRLLNRRKRTTDLDTTHIRLELYRVVVLLLRLLLVLKKEHLVGLLQVRLTNLLLANLAELGGVRDTLRSLPPIREELLALPGGALAEQAGRINPEPALLARLEAALGDELPVDLSEGGALRAGFDAELDRHFTDLRRSAVAGPADDDVAVLVITAGDRRVDEAKVQALDRKSVV